MNNLSSWERAVVDCFDLAQEDIDALCSVSSLTDPLFGGTLVRFVLANGVNVTVNPATTGRLTETNKTKLSKLLRKKITRYIKVDFPENQAFMNNPKFDECLYTQSSAWNDFSSSLMVPEDLYKEVLNTL